MSDAELERYCNNNPNCGCNCMSCLAFAANYKYNNQYQYDYRTALGELFSCVAPTLEACRAKRDKWLQMQVGTNKEA